MTVERSSGNHYICCQPQAFCPFGRERAYCFVGRFGLGKQSVAESGQCRVELGQELFAWQSVPFLMPHGFVTAGTTAADNVFRLAYSCDECRQPFAVFHDGVGFLSHLRIFTEDMQCFCPIPFGGVDTSFIGGVVDIPFFAELIDLGCFLHGSMVFPEDEHRIRVLGKFRQQGEGSTILVSEGGSTSGSVESNTYYLFGCSGRTLCEGFPHAHLQCLDIVQRVLAVLIDGGIAILALFPSRIIFHSGGKLFACLGVDDDGAG